MKTYLIIISVLTYILSIQGSNDAWFVFDTSNSDLPHNEIYSLASDGYVGIWVGTQGGLALCNGGYFEKYTTENSDIPSNEITAIGVDSNKVKWIGTAGHGLAKFTDTAWTLFDTLNSNIPSNDIDKIDIDIHNNVWIISNKGLVKFDGLNWTLFDTSNSTLPCDQFTDITSDSNGNLWLGTFKGVIKFDGVNSELFDTSNSELPDQYVMAIDIDKNNNKWVGTYYGGMAMFNDASWKLYNSDLFDYISDIYIEDVNNIWVISDFKGAINMSGGEWFKYDTLNTDLPHNRISSVTIDVSGNKWFGTTHGLAIFNHGTPIEDKKNNHVFTPFRIIDNKLVGVGNIKCNLYDLSGRRHLLFNGQLNGSYKLDLSKFSKGVYITKIIDLNTGLVNTNKLQIK